MKSYLVVDRSTLKVKGVFSKQSLATEWMDTEGISWPEYTVHTWIMDCPDDSFEEWI